MRLLLLAQVSLSAFWLVVLLLALVLGNWLAGPPAALNGLDACTLPCWKGIIPGETRLRDADRALAALDYTGTAEFRRERLLVYGPADPLSTCKVALNYQGSLITSAALTQCPGVRLGDVMAVLGAPDGISLSGTALIFRDGMVAVTLFGDRCQNRLSPYDSVLSIFLNARIAQPTSIDSPFPPATTQIVAWRGFMSMRRYQRIDPALPAC